MKYITLILIFIACSTAYAQYNPKEYHDFEGKKVLVFEDGFDIDKPEWHMLPEDPTDTTENYIVNTDSIDFKKGIIYLYNNCNETVGNEAKIDMDYSRNFEIVLVAKALYDENNDTSYWPGYLQWDINEQTGQYNMLFFRGFFNEFHTHTGLDTNTNRCRGYDKHLKYLKNTRNKFVRYTIRKYNNKYYAFVNGMLKGTFPYAKLNGTNIGIGARRNSKVEFDFLGVYYLP